MILIALFLGVIFAPGSFAQEAEPHRFPKDITQMVDQIQPRMSHDDLMAVIMKKFPKAHSIGESWGGGGGTINFDLDGRYTLSLAEVQIASPHRKEPKFVNPESKIRVYDRKNKWTLSTSLPRAKKINRARERSGQPPANHSLDRPAAQ
jgi:hypothetical protein